MGLFDMLFAKKKEEKLMQDKTSRLVAIVVSYTPAEALTDAGENCYGKATFKTKRNGEWVEFESILREDVGTLVAGDQWIVKFDEDFTRVVTPQRKLCRGSEYKITDAE